MLKYPTIIFVCEHGAAKSILAATYFNRFARERDLHFHAMARGTHPDPELSAVTVAGLNKDGLTPGESAPQKLLLNDIESAQRIIAFCDLAIEFQQTGKVVQWEDIPAVSENYERARDIILGHLIQLVNNL